ncbi:MAG: Do family serine endopeptidase, partial [Paracoccaceae bacterium]
GAIPDFGGRPVPRKALGSGFIFDPEGYIITNFHVVEKADSVKVRLADDREFPARVIGSDKQTDLALLRVETDDELPFVKLGDSDAMRVGDDVMAVGNPFGLGGTVTRGIVSAKGRDIQAGPYVDFIQTDASINRGNSGGPLFNMNGEVIGVNSAIYSPSGGSVGLGFAIPSNIVKDVVSDLRSGGKVKRGWLGVTIQNVTPDIAEAIGMDEPHGALVAEVVPDGPSAGVLKPGDVIVTFGGKDVASSRELPKLVARADSGSSVDIGILRNGDSKTVTVTIGTFKAAAGTGERMPSGSGGAGSEMLGATVAPLTDTARASLGLDESVKGALVTSLKPNGAAAEAGVQVGDVIVRVGRKEIDDPADLDAALAALDKDTALLMINRHGRPFFIGVKVGA